MASFALLVTLVPAGAAVGSSDTSVRWTSFSESSSCGAPYTGTPIMSRSGALSASEPLLGPFGTYFGRTLAEVRSELVWWTVPGSGGMRVQVNRVALPAFQTVSKNLAKHAVAGRHYRIESASAHTGRTINGSRQLSRHALGLSIDLNPASNPYREDPEQLITDMPGWFVDAWRSAGFCWGGDWRYSKDPMHFSWIGPAPGSGTGLEIRPPAGRQRPFAVATSFPTEFGDEAAQGTMLLADAAGFGAVDVVRVRPISDGMVFDVSGARAGFGRCSMFRWFVPADLKSDDLVTLGDIDGDSRSDVVVVRGTTDGLEVITALRSADFEEPRTISLSASATHVAVADSDGDRRGDLWLFDDRSVSVFAGPDFDRRLATTTLPQSADYWTVADRDGDATVEIFAMQVAGETVKVDVLASDAGSQLEAATLPLADVVAFGAADEDGDGRADVVALDALGALTVATGNTGTGRPIDGWWRDPGFECEDAPVPLRWIGTFYDDDGSVFESDIEWIAEAGITRGCNPPFEDAFCPLERVTRGQMAAFLVRSFDLEAESRDIFEDDDDSIFEADIQALAAAGVTKGCGTGSFCPDRPVTRGEMAAFLARALGLTTGSTTAAADRFVDDDGSVFEREITALAESGVTKGCNPPVNDRFCPNDPVSREQMAAFLHRALR